MYDFYSSYSEPSYPVWPEILIGCCMLALLALGVILFFKIWSATDEIKKISDNLSAINQRQINSEKKDEPQEKPKWVPSWLKEKKTISPLQKAIWVMWVAFSGIVIGMIASFWAMLD